MKNEFYFPSKDGNTEIHAVEWKPEGEVKAVIQICHGMAEHIGRYDEFADFLTSEGYYVIGHDHLGHGKSVQSRNEYGFFDEKHGNACVVGDIHTLHLRTAKKYPDVPYFMLGHSMGSLLVRQYVQTYGNALAGAIIMGVVADTGTAKIKAGRLICRTIATFRGWHYRSRFVNNLAVGKYNKSFKHPRTSAEWITKVREKQEAYVRDPMCSFIFTVNGYYHLFGGMLQVVKKESAYLIPKNLPMLIMAGSEDPAGNFGRGVRKLYERYKKAGIKDITLRLYAGDRHELLNESDRRQIFKDISDWLENKRENA